MHLEDKVAELGKNNAMIANTDENIRQRDIEQVKLLEQELSNLSH